MKKNNETLIKSLKEDMPEISVDFSKNKKGNVNINLNFNKTLSEERKSLEKEHSDIIKYRAMGFIEDLLPVLDSFHMALANEPTSQELKNYLVGFQFVYRNLVNVLENEGVKEIAPKI